MKRFTTLLLVLVFAVPIFARSARPKLTRVAANALTVERMPDARARTFHALRQSRAAAAQKGVPRTNAVIINRSARALVIPAAGSVQGNGGTFFRSDVTLANWNDRDQILGIVWVPNGDPAGVEFLLTSLPPLSIVTAEDFVGDFLELTGLGAIVLFPLANEAGDFDETAAIDAFSRIWTPQPNATGTVSQPFPAVEPDYMTNQDAGIVLGLRQDAQYRTNFGLVNISEDNLTFEVDVLAEEGTAPATRTVTVPSLGMVQQSIASGTFGPLSLGVTVPNPPAGEYTWIAFASSTDNTTGDGWVSIVANPFDDAALEETGQ